MKYHVQSAKITSPTTDGNWGGCFVEGGLVVLLEIETDGNTLASHIGKSVFDALLLVFRNLKIIDKNSIKVLLSEISGNPFIKNAIIGLINGTSLYLGCFGKGQVVLVRGEDFGSIVSGGYISAGEITVNDRIIFHSDRLAGILGSDSLEKFYKSKSLEDFEEELSTILSSEKNSAGCAVLELQVTGLDSNVNQNHKKILVLPKLYLSKIGKFIILYLQKKTKRQKIFLALSSLLLLFFITNIFLGLIRTKNSRSLKELNEIISIVNSQYEEAGNLIELNPVRARELLASAKLSVTQKLPAFRKNSNEHKMLQDWFKKISESEVTAFKIYKFASVPVFFDVSLIKAGAKGNFMSSFNEKKAILDQSSKTVYFLDTSTKQSSVLIGSDTVKNGRLVTIHGNEVFVLNEEGIFRIDLEKKNSEKIIESDENWGEIAVLNAFGGNLYLLDKKNNTVWKYISTETGYTDRKNYINPGVPADFSNSNLMVIDGSVWVNSGNSLIKFVSGNRAQFSFQGFTDSISQIDSLSTSDSGKNIYLLDKALKRIIVFDKDGLYHSQYQWEDLKNADSIIASEEEGKIYVLINSKIYAIEIK